VTAFSFDHVFAGVTPLDLLRAFTHPDHQAAQDRAGDVERREILERVDTDERYRCDSWVFPRRKLPALIRPLVRSGLEVHEVVTWDKRTTFLEIDMQPAVLGGRTRILTRCKVEEDPEGARRIYRGTVVVEIALIGGRVEKMIVEELGRSMDSAHRTTLRWLAESATARSGKRSSGESAP
jgi:hypothetical protein